MNPLVSQKEKLSFKMMLKIFCIQAIEQRITFARTAMDNAQNAANNEEKSSAGDKYETSRAMNQLEKDMHARQLAAHLRELSVLQVVNTAIIYPKVAAGAVIQCAKISFFIAAGLGRQVIDDNTIIFLSPEAPLAKKLSRINVGNSFDFNGERVVLDVY